MRKLSKGKLKYEFKESCVGSSVSVKDEVENLDNDINYSIRGKQNKKEYFVHVWGGMFSNNNDPSIIQDYGIKEGCYYFKSKREKNKFIKLLNNPRYTGQTFVTNSKHGYMSHKRTIYVGLYKYKRKYIKIYYDFGYEYEEEVAEYMFTMGNYSCDCNLSLFIIEQYGNKYFDKELQCGDEIELIDYEFKYLD